MPIFLNDIRSKRVLTIVWALILAYMLLICIIIYPEMQAQMNEISDAFSNMGAFSDAFGMDQLNFGEFMGYFGIECANNLGLGGGLLAAILGISALSKEEKDGTAEFLLSHPVTRKRVVSEKLLAVFTQLLFVNLVIIGLSVIGMIAINADANAGKIALIFLATFIMQLEIAAISFGISAFLRRGGIGIGLGIAFAAYFLNVISNLTDELEFIKYITPYGYTDSGYILEHYSLDFKYLALGIVLSILGIVAAYLKYNKKDIY